MQSTILSIIVQKQQHSNSDYFWTKRTRHSLDHQTKNHVLISCKGEPSHSLCLLNSSAKPTTVDSFLFFQPKLKTENRAKTYYWRKHNQQPNSTTIKRDQYATTELLLFPYSSSRQPCVLLYGKTAKTSKANACKTPKPPAAAAEQSKPERTRVNGQIRLYLHAIEG